MSFSNFNVQSHKPKQKMYIELTMIIWWKFVLCNSSWAQPIGIIREMEKSKREEKKRVLYAFNEDIREVTIERADMDMSWRHREPTITQRRWCWWWHHRGYFQFSHSFLLSGFIMLRSGKKSKNKIRNMAMANCTHLELSIQFILCNFGIPDCTWSVLFQYFSFLLNSTYQLLLLIIVLHFIIFLQQL